MSRIAGVVIARNEKDNIARCLQSLSFCDEIIVVDSGSTDGTPEIARGLATKVLSREWTGYTDQKNFATGQATAEWVLNIDADEEVTPELKKEILRKVRSNPPFSAFTVPRRTLHSGRWIRFGGWYPNRLVRFYLRAEGKWVGEEVHERWETPGAVGDLECDLVHHSFVSISDQVQRNDEYSTLLARRLWRQGVKFSWVKLVFKPWTKFGETYLLKMGFRDGCLGFIISVSAAYSVFLKWSKLWELQRDGAQKH